MAGSTSSARTVSRSRHSIHNAGSAATVDINVQDEGPGVSEPELEQIFTPFYTSKADGLGLGLSMSRSIIEGFGGELQARRQPVGLLMGCRLPLAGPTKQQQE